MKFRDNIAIWCFAILLLRGIFDISIILEFGNTDLFFEELWNVGGYFLITKQFLYYFIQAVASLYLMIIYPILLIKNRRKLAK